MGFKIRNPIKSVINLGKNIVNESVKAVDKTVGTIGDVSTDIYHGVGDLGENIGKGTEKALEQTQQNLEGFGRAVNWTENRGKILSTAAAALTGDPSFMLEAAMAGHTMIDAPHMQKEEEIRKTAEANRIAQEANMMSKQNMLANELSMTARRAMSKRAQANLRKNTSTPASQFLGGEQQTLG